MTSRRVPMRGSDRTMFLVAILTITGSAVFAASIYPDLPDRVPSHFNAAGEADAYGPKLTIWMMPVIMVVLVVVLYVVALFNTNTTKDGRELSAEGHRTVIGHMRRLLGILALMMAVLSWEAVLVIAGTIGGGIMLTLTMVIPIAISIGYSVRIYRVMKQDSGTGVEGPLL